MSQAPLTGRCLCGGVRFEVTSPPGDATYCHCTRCQRRTGGATSAQAMLAPGSFRILEGAELVREYAPPTGFLKAFCSACGSALYSRNPASDEPGSVRLGALDPGHGIRPQLRQFVAYAAAWEDVPDDGLPRHEERRP
jgi:hypothetical protein